MTVPAVPHPHQNHHTSTSPGPGATSDPSMPSQTIAILSLLTILTFFVAGGLVADLAREQLDRDRTSIFFPPSQRLSPAQRDQVCLCSCQCRCRRHGHGHGLDIPVSTLIRHRARVAIADAAVRSGPARPPRCCRWEAEAEITFRAGCGGHGAGWLSWWMV
ncbi:hypothetical protein VTK26DRAFT_6167 [Humicola hyalothermophila]